ncbi:MAG: TIGR00282 family metallophosphoesterase [bacterium]|nr:TIGR00282 family metallophosphoesterase [bacterium]
MRFLIFGDVVAKIGRRAVAETLPELRRAYAPDLVLANIENLAHGLGFTAQTVKELRDAGVDVFTGGNHIWHKPEGVELLRAGTFPIARPANYPAGAPGNGWVLRSVAGTDVLVVNLIGRVFMKDLVEDPFRTFDAIREAHPANVILVDFHGETTSERGAFAWYVDGRASVLYGTHTHVPTADERIFPRGTGFITDVGMTGARDSVIGVTPESVLPGYLTGIGTRFVWPESGMAVVNALVADVDPATGKTTRIERIKREIPIA